jgi:hypothetical protein
MFLKGISPSCYFLPRFFFVLLVFAMVKPIVQVISELEKYGWAKLNVITAVSEFDTEVKVTELISSLTIAKDAAAA